MTALIKLSVPIDAFVLGTGPTNTYVYRVDSVTPKGPHKGNWKTDNLDTIFVVPG